MTRTGRVTERIRPDIHSRFAAIVAKVDAELAAHPIAPVEVTRTHVVELFGIEALDVRGRRASRPTDENPSWDDAVRRIEA